MVSQTNYVISQNQIGKWQVHDAKGTFVLDDESESNAWESLRQHEDLRQTDDQGIANLVTRTRSDGPYRTMCRTAGCATKTGEKTVHISRRFGHVYLTCSAGCGFNHFVR